MTLLSEFPSECSVLLDQLTFQILRSWDFPIFLSHFIFWLFFKKHTLSFRTVLVHSTIERKVQEHSHILPAPSLSLPLQQRPTPEWYICYNQWSTLTHHDHPNSVACIMCTLGVVHSVGFDNCIMTCIHHYSIIQSSFIGLKILSALPIHPSFPQNPMVIPDPLMVSIILAFPECNTVGIIQYVAFQIGFSHLEIWNWGSSMFFHGFLAHFFLVLNNILLSECTTVYLSIHLLKGIFVLPSFGNYE